MSIKLFFLQTFKGLKNTYKVETEFDNLLKDYQDFIKVEQSEKLKLFLELEKEVNSDSFIKNKKEIKASIFKGSSEEKQYKEFQKLGTNKKLKGFYQVQSSSDLERYNTLKDSEEVSHFVALKNYVENKSYKKDKSLFDKDKKKDDQLVFEETEAYKKYQEYQRLKSSSDIILWQKFPKSGAYRSYKKVSGSSLLNRFEELRTIIESESFLERKSYLEDDKKWEKTEAYQKEVDYLAMKEEALFVNYVKYRGTNAFDFFKNWELVFEDRFENGKLDLTKWQTIPVAAQKTIGKNISQLGDLQAYTDGGNIELTDNHLRLTVKKEKTDTMVWDFSMGLTVSEMDYSAGLLTTGEAFHAKNGILEAKIKYTPKKQLVDVFYLTDENNETRLTLVESGKVNRMGLSSGKENQYESISGLQAGQYYIFCMEWSENKVSWKINNQLIFETSRNVPGKSMSINISTIVLDQISELPHRFDIDWIRFYQRKS